MTGLEGGKEGVVSSNFESVFPLQNERTTLAGIRFVVQMVVQLCEPDRICIYILAPATSSCAKIDAK